MKQRKKLFIVSICLLILHTNLLAQQQKGLFNLQKGDWFEYQVDINSTIQTSPLPNSEYYVKLLGDKFKNQYVLRYILTKQLANANQQFLVTIERVKYKLKASSDETWTGYDSFYPVYTQVQATAPALSYTIEISPAGKLINLMPDPIGTMVSLEEMTPKRQLNRYLSMTVNPLPSEIMALITTFIAVPFKKNGANFIDGPEKTGFGLKVEGILKTSHGHVANVALNGKIRLAIPFINDKNIPSKIDIPGLSIVLTKASFPVSGNTFVKGRLLNSTNSTNKITVNNKEFIIAKDGSFVCPILLESAREGNISYGGFSFNTFLQPGDTLEISADSKDFKGSLQLSGSAAINTNLANAAEKVFKIYDINNFGNNIKSKETEEFISFQKKGRSEFNKIISSYPNASPVAIDYFTTEWTFLLAETKLYFLYTNAYRYSPKSAIALHGFPDNFFLEIDTLPILMNDFVGGLHYDGYFEWYLPFQQARVGMSGGGQIGFLSNYSLALASLKQFPLYKLLSETLEEELEENTWTENQRIKPYYEDFIANCRDTFFTEPIKKAWRINENWAVGNESPLKKLTLADGTTLNLSKFKGKPLCLIINQHNTKELKPYLDLVKKYNPDEIHFLIAQVKRPQFIEDSIDSALLNLPNVTCIELEVDNEAFSNLRVGMFDTKTFLFDKWLRVIDNNIKPPYGGLQILDVPIRKAIDAKKYTKEKKAEIIKIGGWSLGSIFLVSIAGWSIYRNRLRNVKHQEQVKRQIKELEIKAIRSQMNPHFIFNALNSIQSLINSNQYKEANIYLAKFSTLLRGVLNNSERGMIPLSDELEAVKLYCQLEQLRFEFSFIMNIDEKVNPQIIEIPGMIIQPLVENAIVHGLASKGKKGILEINISIYDSNLRVLVRDNGAGLKKGNSDVLSQKGFGLKLVRERLEILNHKNKKAYFSVENERVGQEQKTSSFLNLPIG